MIKIKLLFVSLFYALLCVCSLCTYGAHQHNELQPRREVKVLFNKEVFEDLIEVSQEVAFRCSHANCTIVGLGRSPTFILAYLQALNISPTWAIQLPLTGFKYGQGKNPPLNEALLPKLFDHFDRFLLPSILGKQAILLVDFADKGESVLSAMHYIRLYLAARNIAINLDYLAIMSDENTIENTAGSLEKELLVTDETKIHRISEDADLYHNFYNGFFDHLSQFGSYSIETDENLNVSFNPKYSDVLNFFSAIKVYFNSFDFTLRDNVTEHIAANLNSDIWYIKDALKLVSHYYEASSYKDQLQEKYQNYPDDLLEALQDYPDEILQVRENYPWGMMQAYMADREN